MNTTRTTTTVRTTTTAMTTAMTTATTMTMTAEGDGPSGRLAFLRLLQLASPTLPIGAFAYSQGLEPAVGAGLVGDEDSARAWILGLLAQTMTHVDLAVFVRLHAAAAAGDTATARRWNAHLLASRATAELQAEDLHLGSALARVLATLGLVPGAGDDREAPAAGPERTYAWMFAFAAARFGVGLRPALEAFAFNWAEAQTSAAVRLVPLGQSAGLRILSAAIEAIPSAVDRALALVDDEIGAAAPRLALLSTAHEVQYSRLFRS
ncbi:MAG: urease accessory UreF family protein [Pseudomonadota bacterium]